MLISNFRIGVFTVPTQTQLESDGTLEWKSTTMVLIELEASGKWSLGYTYGSSAIATVAQTLLKDVVVGESVFDISRIWNKMNRAVRNDGKTGLSAMAIAAIDIALWDLKAKILEVPLVKLLGVFRDKVEAYGSGGFTSYTDEQMQKEINHWLEKGLKKFKIKVGRDKESDINRVQFVRKLIGQSASLMVDANEAYDSVQALQMAQIYSEQNVCWFEQPIHSENLIGMREIKKKFPIGMALTSGEYIYTAEKTLSILNNRSVDIVQLDVTRNKGITGFLQSTTLCQAYDIPVSTHCAPALHIALGCSLPGIIHLENFFDHDRIEDLFFDGVPPIHNGFFHPDLSKPGLGLKIKTSNIERYKS
ncbi:MAG: enolase C-terminal domain-like protein [Bdellovibrio sp.]